MKQIASVLLLGFSLAFAWNAVENSQSRPGQEDKKVTQKQDQKKDDKKDDKTQDQKKKYLADYMRQKLAASNKVLEGLVLDDLKLIAKGSEDLMKISSTERWRIVNDPTYGRFSREYQGTLKKLKEKTRKGSLDGAALAWMDVTMSCIECHEWVRNVIIVDGSELQLPVAASAFQTQPAE